MKTFIITLATAAALASPAMAHARMRTPAAPDLRGIQARALPAVGADAVYANGAYVGADPDPQVRLQLMRSAGNQDR